MLEISREASLEDEAKTENKSKNPTATMKKEGNKEEYTLLCGKKITLTKEESDFTYTPPNSAMDACRTKCPDKEIQGDVNNCPAFLKADAQEYEDPEYQEWSKLHSSNNETTPNSHRQKITRNRTSNNHSKE